MDHRENLLKIVKDKGPLLPSQINKELRTNVLFASAMLAEMVDQKKLKLSSMKVGGSPLYYCEGQEHLLERFSDRLGGNEKAAFSVLKSSRVLRDRDQEPQLRVSLREIRDFAVPLEVTANGQSDLFWKYYLVSDDDANSLIRDYLTARAAPKEKPKEVREVQAKISELETPQEQPVQHAAVQAEQFHSRSDIPVAKQHVAPMRMAPVAGPESPEVEYQPAFSFSTTIDTEEEVRIEKKAAPVPVQEEPAMPPFPEDDEFFGRVRSFFENSGIEIVGFEIVRKGSEYDFTVKLPSNVGNLNYYCKAKSKSKINEGDLSTAYVYGQMKKLPILFVTVGDLTKRAEELLGREFRNMFVKRI